MNRFRYKITKIISGVDNRIIEMFISVLIVFFIIFGFKISLFDLVNGNDKTIFIAILLASTITILTKLFSDLLKSRFEDSVKLTIDYDELNNVYKKEELIKYTCSMKGNEIIIPAILIKQFNDVHFNIIDDKNKSYALPSVVHDNSELIMEAHKKSIKFNRLCIRLDDFKIDDKINIIMLKTSRTTFYDSLLTNRAMDYIWKGISNRDRYECGPYITEFRHSKLSNHLGYNGFIETSDSKIIFVQKHNKVSVGKRALSSSISTSLEVEHVLKKDGVLTVESLVEGMKSKIKKEYFLSDEDFEFTTSNIIAFYRELLEGGKPQFLVYTRLNITSDELKANLSKIHNKALTFIDSSCVSSLIADVDTMYYQKKKFKILPTTTASIVILDRYLNDSIEMS